MTLDTPGVRAQLVALAKTIAAVYGLEVHEDSILAEKFTRSGVFLHSTVAKRLFFVGTHMTYLTGSEFMFFLSVVVHQGDFKGPESDMPANVDKVADTVINEIVKLNLANHNATPRVAEKIDLPDNNLHDYDFSIHQGVAQFTLKVVYGHA